MKYRLPSTDWLFLNEDVAKLTAFIKKNASPQVLSPASNFITAEDKQRESLFSASSY
jgi:hypothetical protein